MAAVSEKTGGNDMKEFLVASAAVVAAGGAAKGQRWLRLVQAESQYEKKKWMYADGLYGERCHEHPGYAVAERMVLTRSGAVKVSG